MVKGISKQVIVVNSPDRKMFDQAIFILSDEAVRGDGVTNEMLIREAKKIINEPDRSHPRFSAQSALCMLSGAILTGIIWLLTAFL